MTVNGQRTNDAPAAQGQPACDRPLNLAAYAEGARQELLEFERKRAQRAAEKKTALRRTIDRVLSAIAVG